MAEGSCIAGRARKDTRMRVAEYRDFITPRPDSERWELIDGVPVLQGPQPGRYQRIVTNLLVRLGDLADGQGGSAYPGLAVLSPAMEHWLPYPDVVVQRTLTDGDGYTGDPLLIAEVLSPSTLVIDRGRKTEFYQTVPSLAVLLLVHQDEARVEVCAGRRIARWRSRVPARSSICPNSAASCRSRRSMHASPSDPAPQTACLALGQC